MMPDKLPSAESRRVIKPESPEPSAGAAAAEQEANRILAGIVKANTINPRKCCDCCFRHWGAWLLLPKGILFFLLKKKANRKTKNQKNNKLKKPHNPNLSLDQTAWVLLWTLRQLWDVGTSPLPAP